MRQKGKPRLTETDGPLQPSQQAEPKPGSGSHSPWGGAGLDLRIPVPCPLPQAHPIFCLSWGASFPQDCPAGEWPGHSCPHPRMELRCLDLLSISGASQGVRGDRPPHPAAEPALGYQAPAVPPQLLSPSRSSQTYTGTSQ